MDALRVPFVLSLPVVVGCQAAPISPWLGRLDAIEGGAESLTGNREAPFLEARFGGVVRDAPAERRMGRIAARLCGSLPDGPRRCRCRLLRSGGADAFSLPGGLIYVTRGYYDRLGSDDHLAAVLAHELAHLEAGDGHKPPCRTRGERLARECSADRQAIGYLRRSGYREQALVEALRIMARHRSGWHLRRRIEAASKGAEPEAVGPPLPGQLANRRVTGKSHNPHLLLTLRR